MREEHYMWFIRLPVIHIKRGSVSDDKVVFEMATGTHKGREALPVHRPDVNFIYGRVGASFKQSNWRFGLQMQTALVWRVIVNTLERHHLTCTALSDLAAWKETVDSTCCRMDYMDLAFLPVQETLIALQRRSLESLQVYMFTHNYQCYFLLLVFAGHLCDLQTCFQKSKICADWITLNCNYRIFKMWHYDIVTSHTWRRVFADTNNLWLTVYL